VAKFLITGGAGFIGSHVARRLLGRGDEVVILDNLDPFYDPRIKRRNLAELEQAAGDALAVVEGDIRSPEACAHAVRGVSAVIHLAALAGVRPSIADPVRYMDVNVVGTQVLLEAVRKLGAPAVPVVYGSSSSVYGGNVKVPFAETDPVDHPVSPYAASKKAGEVQCAAFHHLSGNPVVCLRFFTVYGPGQRPEMAIHKFCRLMLQGQALPFFGDGSTRRDYTYVDDIVAGVVAAADRARGYEVYNLGGSQTTTLADLVRMLEAVLGRRAVLDRKPEQPGDVRQTYADTRKAARDLGYRAEVDLREGLRRFADWYLAEREQGRLE
jgi:UDP-glucuronate 4-epimerase